MVRFISTLILCGVLCSTFINYGANDCFFLLFPFAVSVGAASLLALVWSVLKGNSFRFTLPDGLITAGVTYYIIRYDYQLHLADWKVVYAALLLLLWYALRVISSSSWMSARWLSAGVVAIGYALAGWGLLQLYGLCQSNHFLYRITGPFFNPGPYSGYLAMLLPVCLHGLLVAKDWKRYYWAGALALMLCIIPAAMSRSAWLAIIVSLLWVVAMHQGWFIACKSYIKHAPRKATQYALAGCIVVGLAAVLLFQLKADSARGRLFIWKNTCTAIMESPLTGHGPGSFQMVYGKAQAAYIAADKATTEEKRVAGYAEYGFNEYLQTTIEGGVVLLLLIIAFGIFVFRRGVENKRYGFCGALLAVAVFALSSYPMQILPFGMAVVIFSAVCVSGGKKKDSPTSTLHCIPEEERQNDVSTPYIYSISEVCKEEVQTTAKVNFQTLGATVKINSLALGLSILLCTGTAFGIYKLRNLDKLGGQWYNANTLLYSQVYDAASTGYKRIYPRLHYHPEFLTNYAKSLHAEGKHLEACKVLDRAMLVSCNADIRNMQGRYYQAAGYYRSAEHCYKQSLSLTPERLYPYYLLAKLYAEPKFLNKEKTRQMANIVLTKSPKVHSKAVDEMREEMRLLLSGL